MDRVPAPRDGRVGLFRPVLDFREGLSDTVRGNLFPSPGLHERSGDHDEVRRPWGSSPCGATLRASGGSANAESGSRCAIHAGTGGPFVALEEIGQVLIRATG